MPSKLDIINSALVSLGASPVQDLDENPPARAAAIFYRQAVPTVLRSHPWNFAIKRRTLAAESTAPDHGYNTAFPLPSDWIRTLSTSESDFKSEGGKILCNATILQLRYVGMVDDPAKFDALFAEALSEWITVKMAYPLTQSASQKDICWNVYKEILRLARSVDSLEEPPDEFEESSLLAARR